MKETSKTDSKKGAPKQRKKIQRNVPSGVVHVNATFNNTIIAITTPSGDIISWASAGKVGYVGSRKSSAYAATIAAQDAAKNAMAAGMKSVEIILKGPGQGRESAVRGIQSAGLEITVIRDKTPVPHNGCRPRKRRRV